MDSKEKKSKWACVIYPESMPEDWLDVLRQSGLRIAISPLHDRDNDPTGQPKKPHYHIIIVYNGPTTFNSVRKFTERLNAPAPIPLEAVRGYYRYLTHQDNPDKYQYDPADIQTLNGFNIADYMEFTQAEIMEVIRKVTQFIFDNRITEYAELMATTMQLDSNPDFDQWFNVISSHTIYFTSLLRSLRHKKIDVEIPAGITDTH